MFSSLGPRSTRLVAIERRGHRFPRTWRARTVTALAAAGVLVSLAGPAPAATSDAAHSPAAHGRSAGRTQAVRVGPAFFGMHDGSQQAYGRLPFGSIRLWDSAVTWKDIETSPGVYDWARLDTLVTGAQEHGVQVTMVLAMTPSFYSDAESLPPTQLADYRNFVSAVMTRYRDFNGQRGISSYQVWNEGNVPTFWTGTPYQLAELTRVVYNVRAQVDPAATIVAPAFAMRLPGQRQWFSQYQQQRVGGKPVSHFYDVNAVSLYPKSTYNGRVGGPEDAMNLLSDVHRRLAAAGVPQSKPLWATEINYGLQSGAPGNLSTTPISERRQIANVIRTYLLGAARGLSRVFWYRYDWGRLPASQGGGTLGNTLLSTPGSPDQVTPAGRAMSTVTDWMQGKLIGRNGHQPCAQDKKGTYTCLVRYSGGVRRIYWNPQHGARVTLPPGADYRQTSSGNVAGLRQGATTLHVGYRPVMINSPVSR